MNTKKVGSKLVFSKKTIANLSQNAMDEAKGGIVKLPVPTYNSELYTVCYCSWVFTCDVATCNPSWCGDQCR
jgi:hypothetical protein